MKDELRRAKFREMIGDDRYFFTCAGNDREAKGANALAVFAEVLKTNTILTSIGLGLNHIGNDGAKALAEMLKTNASLTDIETSGNEIGADGAKALADMLKTNASLTSIDLSGNLIGNAGAKALADMLKTNTTLISINLSDNRIGADGANALAEALKTNTSLRSITLDSNRFGTDGARAIAEALKTNTSLTSISLNDTEIADDGAKAVAEALKTNTSLTSISLIGNMIGINGAKALAEALKVNTSLTSIDLKINSRIGDNGAKAVAEALKTNTSLISIDLHLNNIGADGAKAIAGALKTNTNLTSIDLSSNEIDENGARALVEMLYLNNSLTLINLSDNNNIDNSTIAQLNRLLILKKMPFTTVRAEAGRTYPPVSPFYGAKQNPSNINHIEFALLEIKKNYQKLLDLDSDIDSWTSTAPTSEKAEVNRVHLSYLENIAFFHLRCLDVSTDDTPITNLHRNILAVDEVLAQIPNDSRSYKTVCFHLGDYYLRRACTCGVGELEAQQAFAKTAINYWNVCLQDHEFCNQENIKGELSCSIPLLISMVLNEEIDELSSAYDESKWQAALANMFADEKSPHQQKAKRTISIRCELLESLNRRTLDYFNLFLDEQISSLQQLEQGTSASSTRLFDPNSMRSDLISAIKTLKDACNGVSVNSDNLKKHIELLKGSKAIQPIGRFIKSCAPLCIINKKVATFDELANALTTRSGLSQKKMI